MSLVMLWCFCRANGLALAFLATGCGGDAETPAAIAVAAAATPPSSTPIDPTATAVIVQSGDSIGAGFGADDWAAIDHLSFADSVAIHNVSVVGIAMQAGYGRRTTDLFLFENNRVPSVLVIQQGTNDLYYGTAGNTLYKSVLGPFVSSAHAAGFYVVVETVLPRADSGWTPGMEQQRGLYNALIRTNAAGADAVNDVAADPLMGDGTNPAASIYYADGAHPTLAGQQHLAMLGAAVLAPFLQRPARTH
jgi:lysophospholipase L1-like esterase